jgi:hypothetical protein
MNEGYIKGEESLQVLLAFYRKEDHFVKKNCRS